MFRQPDDPTLPPPPFEEEWDGKEDGRKAALWLLAALLIPAIGMVAYTIYLANHHDSALDGCMLRGASPPCVTWRDEGAYTSGKEAP